MDFLTIAKSLAERVGAEAKEAKAPAAVFIVNIHGTLALQQPMNGAPLLSLVATVEVAIHQGNWRHRADV